MESSGQQRRSHSHRSLRQASKLKMRRTLEIHLHCPSIELQLRKEDRKIGWKVQFRKSCSSLTKLVYGKNQIGKEEGSDPLAKATLSQPISRCAEVPESLKMTSGSS